MLNSLELMQTTVDHMSNQMSMFIPGNNPYDIERI